MATKFTPSVNIFRDQDSEINYLPTPNAKRLAAQIADDFNGGFRSFTIIGSYGTGKSSFLWALSNVLRNRKHFFDAGGLETLNVEVLPLIGEFSSLSEFFANKFLNKNASTEEVFAEIYHRYHQLGANKGLLVLMIDEFGKFLEYATKNIPERELYFLQQLAEFVNNPVYNIILVTTLHQNFDAYALSLNNVQRQEWTKVKGRFRELTFNEPVEQLLLLAGERLGQKKIESLDAKLVEKATQLFLQTKAFSFTSSFAKSLAPKLFPLDLLTASVSTLAMQRYGQNERSLFSFLEGTEHTSINGNYDRRSNPFYNLSNLYDNLIFNYYTFLNSKYNPDLSAWIGIKGALEKVENEVEGHFLSDSLKLIKSVGLLNIFASKGSKLDETFLLEYAEHCLGVLSPPSVLKNLIDKKVLSFRKYHSRFVINEGTDVDIDQELLQAGDQIGEIGDVIGLLNKYFSFPAVFAKEYYYQTGTPRIFEFVFSKEPEFKLSLKGDTDGFINLIFNEELELEKIKETSRKIKDKAILFGVYKNTAVIRDLLKEIEKTKKTIQNVSSEDRVAQNELRNILFHQEMLLSHYILDHLYSGSNHVDWVYQGSILNVRSKRDLNSCLTKICADVYHGTPVYLSELVNRNKLSSQVHTAKKSYLRHLVNHWNDPDLGFEKDKFPPEKTIFLTLLKENGLISNPQDPFAAVCINEDSKFMALWKHGEEFLEKAKKHRLPLIEFYESLTKPPFKLKQGLIDFWLPSFLFIKRNEFALFGNGVYLPDLREETLELIAKSPKDYQIKAFDVDGVRLEIFNHYRQLLNQHAKERLDNSTFIETIRPFLSFYRALPDYAKHTKRLQKETLAIRKAIATATDPEKTFFEDFPLALGLTLDQLKKSSGLLEGFISRLQTGVRELQASYDELINRFEAFITEEILYESLAFEEYKTKLNERFKGIKQHQLLPHHKTLLIRLSSELDDRKAWLNSLAQAIIGTTLEKLKDEDEPLLYDKLKNYVLELDTLTNLSQQGFDEEKESALGLEITTFEAVERKMVRFPKKKKAEISRIEEEIRTRLSKDKTLNIAALANVLKDLLQN